jgi:hypothetical protein
MPSRRASANTGWTSASYGYQPVGTILAPTRPSVSIAWRRCSGAAVARVDDGEAGEAVAAAAHEPRQVLVGTPERCASSSEKPSLRNGASSTPTSTPASSSERKTSSARSAPLQCRWASTIIAIARRPLSMPSRPGRRGSPRSVGVRRRRLVLQ